MNKRVKKKRALQSQVNFLIAENSLLANALRSQNERLTELEKRLSYNVEMTNDRLVSLKLDTNTLRIELIDAVSEFRKSKRKSWFG